MSVNLLHYREWHGHYRRPIWSIWPIARVALATLFRRKMFWGMYAVGLLLFLMFFFGSFLLDWAESQLPATPIQVGNFKADPDRIGQMLRRALRVLNGSQDTFAYFFIYQGSMVMVVLALAGSILVGNDFTQRSLPFYLAKPLSRWHYLGGKCLAVGVVVNLMTTLPALVLFVQHGLGEWDYFVDPDYFVKLGDRGPAGWQLLAGVLAFGVVLTVCLSIMLVAAAAWMRRTVPLIMVWTTVFLFFRLLAGILVDGLQLSPRWRLIDLWNDLCLIGFACLGYDKQEIWPATQPAFLEAGLVLAGVCLACLSYLNLRTRAVEVVR
jgi:ABC-2 type transport system permease protein